MVPELIFEDRARIDQMVEVLIGMSAAHAFRSSTRYGLYAYVWEC